jgi:phospholipase/lecithinase/hemolysin
VETLYQSGARNFLFLTVPPTDRSPLIISGGDWGITTIKASLADYNAQLTSAATAFQQKHAKDIGRVTVFDTQPIFNVYLDQAATFGFVNATG